MVVVQQQLQDEGLGWVLDDLAWQWGLRWQQQRQAMGMLGAAGALGVVLRGKGGLAAWVAGEKAVRRGVGAWVGEGMGAG